MKSFEKKLKEEERLKKMYFYENEARSQGYKVIAGIDEAGRGPWAGPVVVACVVLPEGVFIPGINDSKQVSAKKREELYKEIMDKSLEVSIGICDVHTIDSVNILNATYLGMKKSVMALKNKPDMVLIDGKSVPSLGNFSQISIIKGDALSISIAAASIIAKVTRDRKMQEYDRIYPEYNFDKNKGYGTKEHRDALNNYGICDIHRKSFRPVKEMLLKEKEIFIGLNGI